MNRSERLALIEKLRADNDASIIEIEERRQRQLSEPYQPPSRDLVFKRHESARMVPPQQSMNMDPETQRQWNEWVDGRIKSAMEEREQLLIDGCVAYVIEEVAKLKKEIARLRKDLTREKQIDTAANVDRIIKGRPNVA